MKDYEHHQLEHRTWFPFILIGLTITLAVIIVIWAQPKTSEPVKYSPYVAVESAAVSEAEYQNLINYILKTYNENGDIEAAYQSLLDIVIPSSYKEVHLELVIIMSKYEAGNDTEAQERLETLKEKYPWLEM